MTTRTSIRFGPILVGAVIATALAALGADNGAYDLVTRQTVGLLLGWLVVLLAVSRRAPVTRLHWTGMAVIGAFGLVLPWIAVQFGSTLSDERTAAEFARAATHFAAILVLGLLVPRTWWRGLIVATLLATGLICAAVLLQRLSPGALGFTWYPWTPSAPQRVSFPLGYWNAVGAWATLTALLALAQSSHAGNAWWRAGVAAVVPLGVAVAYLTYSRSAILALVIGLVVLVAAARNRWTVAAQSLLTFAASGIVIAAIRANPQIADGTGTAGAGNVALALTLATLLALLGTVGIRAARLDDRRMSPRVARRAFLITVAMSIVGFGALATTLGPKAWDQLNDSTNAVVGSDPAARLGSLQGTRLDQWRVAMDAFAAEPVHGSGAGTYELLWNRSGTNGEFVRDAHNAFVEQLAEQGLVGFLLLLALLAAAVATSTIACRRVRTPADRGLVAGAAAALAAFFAGTAVDWFWEMTALAAVALVLLGALIGAGAPRDERPVRRQAWWRAVLVIAGLAGVLIQLPGLVGVSQVRRSAEAARSGDLVAARADADEAADIMPWASSPYLQRALVDERAGETESALTALGFASKRDPWDWRIPLVAARVHAEAGQPKEALAAYRRAKALRPLGSFFAP